MGSMGTREIIIVFLVIFGTPIALVALFALLRSRQRNVSQRNVSSYGEIAEISELRGVVSEVVSEHLTSVEAQLSSMDKRLSALENERVTGGRSSDLDKV